MNCCPHCRDAGGFFGARTGRRELKRYRRKGPARSTALLLEGLRDHAPGATLVDVGGGIGAIQHELFRAGLARATQVDASRPYLEIAQAEAAREGNEDRSDFLYGDFAAIADQVPEGDIVTLDRVICCYPDFEALLEAALGRSRHLLGLVYPRERVGTRIALAVANLWFRIRRSAFRTYVHPTRQIRALVEAAGFRPVQEERTFLWHVQTFRREGG